jgi:hypothetical protein
LEGLEHSHRSEDSRVGGAGHGGGREFRSGLAGQAGQGVTAKVGGWGQGAQMARAGGIFTGKVWNALMILGDRNLYLIRAPLFKA